MIFDSFEKNRMKRYCHLKRETPILRKTAGNRRKIKSRSTFIIIESKVLLGLVFTKT